MSFPRNKEGSFGKFSCARRVGDIQYRQLTRGESMGERLGLSLGEKVSRVIGGVHESDGLWEIELKIREAEESGKLPKDESEKAREALRRISRMTRHGRIRERPNYILLEDVKIDIDNNYFGHRQWGEAAREFVIGMLGVARPEPNRIKPPGGEGWWNVGR